VKLILGGKEHDLEKVARRISVWQYLELEDQAGITVDDLERGAFEDGKKISSARAIAAYAFLIRRHHGEDVTFQKAASELVPEDALVVAGDPELPVPPKAPPVSGRGANSAAAARKGR
jgi:hypothetical protein